MGNLLVSRLPVSSRPKRGRLDESPRHHTTIRAWNAAADGGNRQSCDLYSICRVTISKNYSLGGVPARVERRRIDKSTRYWLCFVLSAMHFYR